MQDPVRRAVVRERPGSEGVGTEILAAEASDQVVMLAFPRRCRKAKTSEKANGVGSYGPGGSTRPAVAHPVRYNTSSSKPPSDSNNLCRCCLFLHPPTTDQESFPASSLLRQTAAVDSQDNRSDSAVQSFVQRPEGRNVTAPRKSLSLP